MKREPERLLERTFDVVVVGGGIHGACAAMEAARRGLSVALLERGDFGSATSHNSLKLLHGGFRYIQHLDFRRIRQSIRERRYWLAAAPHMCRPLAFLMPLRGVGTRSRGALYGALKLYELIAADRNRGVPAERAIPAGRIVGKHELYSLAPSLRPGYTSGAIWYDGQMLDADRLLLSCVAAAVESGAVAMNYAAVEGLSLTRDNAVAGVKVRDRLRGEELDVRAKQVIFAAGPWNAALLKTAGIASWRQQAAQVKSMNVVVPALCERDDLAVGIESKRRSDSVVGNTNRLFFVTPWQGLSVIGTTHEPFDGEPEACTFGRSEVEAFLGEFNDAYCGRPVDLDDVVYVYGGLTPAVEGRIALGRSRHAVVTDHSATDGVAGLWSVAGVKFTTARYVAEIAVAAVAARAGLDSPARVPTTALPGGEDFPGEDVLIERLRRSTDLDGALLGQLVRAYGTRVEHVLEAGGYVPGSGEEGVLACRMRYAIREEMAVCIDDLLHRRTHLAMTGKADTKSRELAAALLAEEGGDASRLDIDARAFDSASSASAELVS